MKEEKIFEQWSFYKQQLDARDISRLYYKEREIWFCSIGINVGWEEDGKNETFDRPVIILKKYWPSLFLGVPCSSADSRHARLYKIQEADAEFLVLISQMRVFDARRLRRRIYKINRASYEILMSEVYGWLQNKRSRLSAGSRSRSADAEMPALAALDQTITDVG